MRLATRSEPCFQNNPSIPLTTETAKACSLSPPRTDPNAFVRYANVKLHQARSFQFLLTRRSRLKGTGAPNLKLVGWNLLSISLLFLCHLSKNGPCVDRHPTQSVPFCPLLFPSLRVSVLRPILAQHIFRHVPYQPMSRIRSTSASGAAP
jgi:hypothetical protein